MGTMTEPSFLVTGASGYLGRRLVREAGMRGRVYAAARRPPADVPVAIPVELDVSDRSAVQRVVHELEPAVIIHAAAVNPGQGDDETMWRVNADGSGHVAEGASDVGSRLVAISTDVVHDGRHGPYDDDAAAHPINHYGRSKAAGESATLEHARDASVVRTSLMYALDEMDRGTASFAARINRGEPQTLFSDVLRNPIRVDTLAVAILRLVETAHSGTLNVAGRQVLSREEYGRRMLEYWGVATNGLIKTALAADISGSIPLDLRLTIDRAEELLGMDLTGVDAVLEMAPGAAANEPGF